MKSKIIDIVFEDEHFMAVMKYPHFASVPERGETPKISVLEFIKQTYPDAQLCHRLDKETSGILIIAKTPEFYRHLSMQFEKRKVEKYYHAVVAAPIEWDNVEVNIGLNTENVGKVLIDKKLGKKSQTFFTTLWHTKNFALLQCKPVTGRLHQIRVHLSYMHFPIVSDELYGGKKPFLHEIKRKFKTNDEQQNAMIERVALHAKKIVFEHLDGRKIEMECDYPKDFAVLVKLIQKWD